MTNLFERSKKEPMKKLKETNCCQNEYITEHRIPQYEKIYKAIQTSEFDTDDSMKDI